MVMTEDYCINICGEALYTSIGIRHVNDNLRGMASHEAFVMGDVCLLTQATCYVRT